MFKKILLGAALSSLIAGTAIADDEVSSDDVFAWGGLFIGIDGGFGRGPGEIREGSVPGFNYLVPAPGTLVSSHNPKGLLGGIHAGYRYQDDMMVLGIEASYSRTNIDSTAVVSGGAAANFSFSNELSYDWIAKIGGQVGYAHDDTLFYLSGGYARADVDTRTTSSAGVLLSASSDQHSGFYIGGGIDFGVTENVILGVEYNYLNFRDGERNGPVFTVPGTLLDSRVQKLHLHTFKAKLAYKF